MEFTMIIGFHFRSITIHLACSMCWLNEIRAEMLPLSYPPRDSIKKCLILIHIYQWCVHAFIEKKKKREWTNSRNMSVLSDWSCGLGPSNVTPPTDTDWLVTAMINENPPANVLLMDFHVLFVPTHTHTLALASYFPVVMLAGHEYAGVSKHTLSNHMKYFYLISKVILCFRIYYLK